MSRRRRRRQSYMLPILMSVAVLAAGGLLIAIVLLNSREDKKSEEKEADSVQTPVISITGGNEAANVISAGEEQSSSDVLIGESGLELADEGSEESAEQTEASVEEQAPSKYENGQEIAFDTNWEYGGYSKIHSGTAKFYAAPENRKGIVVGINAGHGTKGGSSVKTYCHPDMTPKVTGGSTAAGAIEAAAVSGGMSFNDGTAEATITLRLARMIRDNLLAKGYDVLMVRDGDDVQLDNVARTVMCNNVADCHIAIHFDGDGLASDKGCFFISVPDGIKSMPPVDRTWQMSEELGSQIVTGLGNRGLKIYKGGSMAIDLTQTSYSSVPSVDVEYGNQSSDISDAHLAELAAGTAEGVDAFFLVAN